ncbi:hypothetical protein K1T71_010443 [Dendrolimus kikuchii]|uniref:Uncharacterized protein n=1 Tax=Dendrolimus kikuchii TaxID=765133 RepID=A0ACC1CST5_9NEOP|nr:hypothetical protein K1T71_010443 [Dendrolimus kikuchii]
MLLLQFLFCVAHFLSEVFSKDRTASLVVLPPLVLGYEELYDDLNPKKQDFQNPDQNNSEDMHKIEALKHIKMGNIIKPQETRRGDKRLGSDQVRREVLKADHGLLKPEGCACQSGHIHIQN